MIYSEIKEVAKAEGVLVAMKKLAISHGLNIDNVNLAIRPNAAEGIVLTTEGVVGQGAIQTITIPENVFEFKMEAVLALFAHELYHVEQRSAQPIVHNKYEREFQAYYEGVFPTKFAHLPANSIALRKHFAEKALHYFQGFEPGSVLFVQYLSQKYKLEEYLQSCVNQ